MSSDFKRFKVLLNNQDLRRYPHWPLFVPWHLVEPHRDRAAKNHSQTLERINERGGLSPRELYAVINDLDYKHVQNLDPNACIREIMKKGGLCV